MTDSNNPLKKYFRQPAIYLKLPSKGNFYPKQALNMPVNGELPIYPMTAIDEINGRTPDALFNGSAVANLIKSCVPDILDPWNSPTTDLNAILVAIRLASYGNNIEINSKCPKCSTDQEFEVDLRIVLDNLKSPNYEETLTDNDLIFYFAPQTYKQANENSQNSFEDQKTIQLLATIELNESEKLAKLGEAFKRITEATIKSIGQSISTIKTADTMVTDQTHIQEFLHNCTKETFERIKNHAITLRAATELPPLNITCTNCEHKYQQEFTLDMSNFFDSAS